MAPRPDEVPTCGPAPDSKDEPDPRPVEGSEADEELALLAKAVGHPPDLDEPVVRRLPGAARVPGLRDAERTENPGWQREREAVKLWRMDAGHDIHLATGSGPLCGTAGTVLSSPTESFVSCPACRAFLDLRAPDRADAERRLALAFARIRVVRARA